MKILLSLILLISSVACTSTKPTTQSNANGNVDADQTSLAATNKVEGQTISLNEQGISFILPTDWRKIEAAESDEDTFTWRGPDKTGLSINVSLYRPEYGNRSIEEETDYFYSRHKEGGSEDLRLLVISGVRGVHFLVDGESWEVINDRPEKDLYRFIKWSSQYMYKGKRRIMIATLSGPVTSFSKHRETLYGILNSISFIQ